MKIVVLHYHFTPSFWRFHGCF